MSIEVRNGARTHPRAVTAVLSIVGYALVIGTFAGLVPIFPSIGMGTVNLLSHLIAIVNTLALSCLLLGWYYVKHGQIRKHRAAMLSAFTLIMVFLVLYLWKVGGGVEKEFVGPTLVHDVYLVMLVIHILLSVVSVPVVIYAVVLGLTHTPAELRKTAHPRVGRIAVIAWTISLSLGIVTYLMLNHLYGWKPLNRGFLLLLAPVGVDLRERLRRFR